MSHHNKRIAAAFRAALKHLWNGKGTRPSHKETFICYAIDPSCNYDTTTCAAKNVIIQRLCYHATARDWLRANGVSAEDASNTQKMQAWRKQWLKQLIEEFENK